MSFIFLLIAFIYSMVGFGGGSSYIAILAIFEIPYTNIPVIALICNLIVVSGGAFYFIRRKHFVWELFWPFIAGSIPMAFVGGSLNISKGVFYFLLSISLLLVALKLLFVDNVIERFRNEKVKTPSLKLSIFTGGALGFFSGMVGVGGGIFLSPILLLMGWGKPKQVAATASLFILVNSFFGLCGQLLKTRFDFVLSEYWLLFLAVCVGGQLGSRLGSSNFVPQRYVKNFTSALVLLVAIRMIFNLLYV